ncbi:flippase-like domain-containing protein [Anaerosalibacter bizertensis]|uniref:Phosphatidylglycerol lysyltransferase n=1 Tax=Anaerosalibacter bizertensis TaxID=932217 RepID=A0A9Q4FKH2_9FIRM|nr:lysylphosphatidylglycerol synthase transmembrane domain-containing protein [Anaerosalibacter bizertensis]MBV1818395.1 flippase-like domain-containing protein [Bacteroidales bacterium MSK.15.36]MCB5559408.1 flippase-like domain-containing protein [Anaerosalibacter bizertensis]MCG4564561.1 flippase-like domain-containing protein [Anaerosalibacter bizertensis]MCG4581718.1 flippase-like domain-containing protein [Anaerosalibacter bizertensis]
MENRKINYTFIAIIIGITLIIILTSEGLKDLPELLINTNTTYLIIALFMMLGDWIFDGIILNIITRRVHGDVKFLKSLKIAIIGQYYSAITPFSTGGQPVQVYLMSKEDISVPKGSLILFNKFIIYQMAVTFYSLTMFMLKLNFIFNNAKTAVPFVIIGFILNLLVLTGIILLFYKPEWINPIVLYIYKFLNKIGIMKDTQKYIDRLDKSMAEYMQSVEKIKEDKKTTMELLILTFIQLTFYFSITYFIYLALGLTEADFIDIIAIQSLVYMSASYIPTPGTAGASEGGYYLLFKPLFTSNLIIYALLLWRTISYYFRILVTGIVTLIDYIIRKKKKIAV